MSDAQTQAAVIVSTYNWPEALRVVLRSLESQTLRPFEVVVADDGSREETGQTVASTLQSSRLRWCHVRQEDAGFRQARARNLGVRFSTAPYLIFIDHDTVLHRGFVAEHLQCARRNVFLQGKRAFLPPTYTARILENPLAPFQPPPPYLPGLGNRKNAVHAPALGRLFMRPRRFQTALRGSNLSVSREDFLRVDGFDETFDQAWGREDSDFCYRLFHCGVRCLNLWFCGLQYHLHHSTASKRRERDALDEELERVRREGRQRARSGFSTMSGEGRMISSSAGYGGAKGA